MSELDKFKRRLIRLVARQIMLQDQPEDVMWEQLRKENNCDCQLLWKRMRALTIKKLKRLLAAEDKTESMAAVARLSVTDWLLFDLVLVHEKLDLIDKESIASNKKESPVMEQLFELVKRYKVERLEDAKLADAWMKLTKAYNTKGRKVSPMLLQRRWYQLKEMTRSTFYQLWFSYRGNARQWDRARAEAEPTPLQALIAREFPELVTTKLPEWEELIKQKKVIVSFEEHQMRNPEPQSDADVSDDKLELEMIEPVIETIDLGADSENGDNDSNPVTPSSETISAVFNLEEHRECFDSDSQSTKNCSNSERNGASIEFNLAAVKQEPMDEDGLTNVRILETSHVEDMPSTSKDQRNKQLSLELETMQQHIESLVDEHTFGDTSETQQPDEITNDDEESLETVTENDVVPDYINKTVDFKSKPALKAFEEETETAKDVFEEEVKELFEDKDDEADEFVSKDDLNDLASQEVKEQTVPDNDENDDEVNVIQSEIKPEIPGVSSDIINDAGIEFVEDGIEDEEDDIISFDIGQIHQTNEEIKSDEEQEDDHESSTEMKFDLKLMMTPVVYTVKLDEMNAFANEPFSCVTQPDVLAKALKESAPVNKTFKQEIKLDEEQKLDNTDPNETIKQQIIIYEEQSNQVRETDELYNINENKTFKQEINLDEGQSEHVRKTEDLCNTVTSENCTNAVREDLRCEEEPVLNATVKIEPQPENCDDFDSDDNDSNDTTDTLEIVESLKVKPTSYIFKKPRHRSYNPIQVCKNPDFNTRLKRLTVGFFTSPRNRQLFNACKPLTVDLSKAFEERLVNGTIYLKSSGEDLQQAINQEEIIQTPTVAPSAVSVQSLLSQADSKADIEDLIPAPVNLDTVDLTARQYGRDVDEMIARNKIINLRDLSEIRRINQNLLTAQVNPIKIDKGPNKNDIEQLNTTLLQDIGEMAVEETMTNPAQETSVLPAPDLISRKPIEKIQKTQRKQTVLVERSETIKKCLTYDRYKPYKPAFNYLPGRVVPVSWRPKPMPEGDACLTNDALNKMIAKLGLDVLDDTSKKKDGSEPSKNEKPDKKRVYITIPPEFIKPDSKSNVQNKPKPKYSKFCCWARLKIDQMVNHKRGLGKRHQCIVVCECCCHQELLDALQNYPSSGARLLRLRDPTVYDHVAQKYIYTHIHYPKVPQQIANRQQSTDAPIVSTDAPILSTDAPIVSTDAPIELSDDEPIEDTPTTIDNSLKVYSDDKPTEKPRLVVESRQKEDTQKIYDSIKVYSGDKPPPKNQPVPNEIPPTPILLQAKPQSLLKLDITFTPSPQPSVLVESTTSVTDLPFVKNISTNPYIELGSVKPNINAHGSKQRANDEINIGARNLKGKLAESPIYLGKDKILLTTVKFPPYLADPTGFDKKEEISEPASVPHLNLPAGVNLVLMSNGQLTCVIDPAVKLTNEEKSVLSGILAAVQKQIDEQNKNRTVSQPPTVVSEVDSAIQNILPAPAPIDASPVVFIAPSVVENLLVERSTIEHTPISVDDTDLNTLSDSEVIAVEEDNSHNSTPVEVGATNLNASNDSDVVNVEEDNSNNLITNVVQATEQNTDKTPNTDVTRESNSGGGSRNLLSDLMEMSGIFEEDATPLAPAISESPTVSEIPSVQTLASMPAPGMDATELTPITNITQLKYACVNNGKFFKLDLITGVLVSINVCLRKKSKNASGPPTVKAVVDLTDDNISTENNKTSLTLKGCKMSETQKSGVVKNVNLVKAVHARPIILRKTQISKAYSRLKRRSLTNANTNKTESKKSRTHSNKIEAKIDLVDSDEPMEEEYLIDSSDSAEPTKNMRIVIDKDKVASNHEPMTIADSDDSSDDEPLAQKSARIRAIDLDTQHGTASTVAIESHTLPVTPVVPPSTSDITPDKVAETLLAGEASKSDDVIPDPNSGFEVIPESIESQNMELEEMDMPFMDATTEQEDDCILGV